MKKELFDYFYKHYEDNGEPYADPTSYEDVSEFMKAVKDDTVQALIYSVGIHEIAKRIVFNAIERLD